MKRMVALLLGIALLLMSVAAADNVEVNTNLTVHTGKAESDIGGEVKVRLILRENGDIAWMFIDASTQTPGMGTRCADDENFKWQFLERSGPFILDENVDALTGATVTSTAIVEAINTALKAPALAENAAWIYAQAFEDEYIGVGVTDEDGVITSLFVDAGSQTPGLGRECASEAFTSQFIGKRAPLTLNDEIDAVASATTTSQAVVDAVNNIYARADSGRKDALIGSYITFGTYPQTAAGKDKTPIEWLVLDCDGSKALLVSRYGLDEQRYADDWKFWHDTTWADSRMRFWLNGEFMNRAFTQTEQEAILLTVVQNDESQNMSFDNFSGGTDTWDKVFLLSAAEVKKYFPIAEEDYDNESAIAIRRLVVTPYAIAQQAWVETINGENVAILWDTRSPYGTLSSVAQVQIDGHFQGSGVNGEAVVRPALWVDLDSDIFQ